MRHLRRAGLCLVAVLAMSAIATSIAAAEEPIFKVGEIANEVATRHVLAPSEKRGVTVHLGASRIRIPTLSITITCTTGTGKGEIYNGEVENLTTHIKYLVGSLDHAEVTFEGCAVEGAPACYINGAISGAAKISATELAGKLGYDPKVNEVRLHLTSTKAGSVFTTFDIEECAMEGAYPLKKGVIGLAPNAELEKLKKELNFTFAVNGADLQLLKEISNPQIGTTEVDELVFGAHAASLESGIELKVTPKVTGEGVGIYR
jgi:hypothetical protein